MHHHRPTEILTRIQLAYDIILTASCLNPMPDQEGNFLPLELCSSLHSAVDQLKALQDEVEEVVKEGD